MTGTRVSGEVIPYALPFKRPYETAAGRISRREIVLLRLSDEEGLTGLGEAVPLSLRGGDSLDRIVEALESWVASGEASPMSSGPPPARCAVETALADLGSQRLGMPLHQFLGGDAAPARVRCNGTAGAGRPREVASAVENLVERGFQRVKLKVGTNEDETTVLAVKEVIGDEVKLRLDGNGAWDVDRTLQFLDRVGADRIELLEQPVAGIEGLRALRSATDLPLVADESVTDPEQAAEASRLDACDAVTVKLSKVGGLDGTLGGFLPTYLSSALDGPVGLAAAAHLAMTLPSEGPFGPVYHGLATGELFEGTIASVEPVMVGEEITVPPGPGLGVVLDESALEAHRL